MNESETTQTKQEVGQTLAPTACSAYYPLFEHMSKIHNLTLLDSELEDICQVVEQMRSRKTKCRNCGDQQRRSEKAMSEIAQCKCNKCGVVLITREPPDACPRCGATLAQGHSSLAASGME